MSEIGVRLEIPVPEIDAVMEDYTSIRVYRASSFAGSYSVITTITLVADQTAYTYEDTSGTVSSWYRFSWYNTSTTAESTLSDPQPGSIVPLYTRQELRRRAANLLGLYGKVRGGYTFPGVSGTTTAAGTTTTVVASAYANSRYDALDWKGWYCLLNDGSAAGEERQISDFAGGSGTFTVTPAYSAAPGNGTTFDLYGEAPSDWWDECVDEARADLWIPFVQPVAGIADQREYVLPGFIARPVQVQSVSRQSGEEIRNHLLTPGQDYQVLRRSGGVVLYLERGLSANSVFLIEGLRSMPAFLSDSAPSVALNDQLLRIVEVTIAQKAAERLAQAYGMAEDRSRWERDAAKLEIRRRALVREYGMWPSVAQPWRSPWVGTGTRWEY